VIAKPLEATVAVTTDDPVILAAAEGGGLAEIEEFLILSNLSIAKGTKDVVIGKTEAAKCERCWRHRDEVGSHAEHPTLCGRCVEALPVSA
jgi:isoleucyl-tRNA synthetase